MILVKWKDMHLFAYGIVEGAEILFFQPSKFF